MNENKKKIAGTMALMAVLVSGVVGGGIFLTKNIGKSAREISKEEAKSLIETKVYKGLEPFFDNLKPFDFVKETFENMDENTY
mgnify:CR=1 FL=1